MDLNGTQAAIRSGYSPNGADVAAVRLLGDARIAARVKKRQAEVAQKLEITLERLTNMTLEAYRIATEDGSAKGADAAVKAVAQLSRMHGFDVRKRPNERSPIDDLTAEERDAVRKMVEEALERAGADA